MKKHKGRLLCLVLTLALALSLAVTASAAEGAAAVPKTQVSAQLLNLDGQAVECEHYNIDGANFFKLRDLALLLSGTPTQFDVAFDEAAHTVDITKGAAYTPVGGELEAETDKSETCQVSDWTVRVDGAPVYIAAYNIGGNNYFKLRALAEQLGFVVDYFEETDTAFVSSDKNVVIWPNDSVTSITDPRFDSYFEGTAAEGVEALLNAGQFYVNGLKVPATEDEMTDYQVNWVSALYKGDNGWGVTVHKTIMPANMSFTDARITFINALTQVRGHIEKITLDETGHAVRIDANHYDSVVLADIFPNNESTTIRRGEFDLETNRTRYDADLIQFPTRNFDKEAQIGDLALYWYGRAEGDTLDGWHLERAIPVVGRISMDTSKEGTWFRVGRAMSHVESNINRYCLMDSSRPHQFYLQTYERLGLTELDGIMWCTPTGNVAGFTFGENGKTALTQGIAAAQALKADVAVSADGTDVPEGQLWVTQEAMDEFDAAIAAAEAVVGNNATGIAEFGWAAYRLGQAVGEGGNRPSGFVGSQGEGSGAGETEPAGPADTGFVRSIVINMGEDKTLTDALYDGLYAGGSAEEGVNAIIDAGNFVINGFAVPADEAAFQTDYPDGFTVNGDVMLEKTEEGYKVDRNTYETYAEAAHAMAGQVRNGLEAKLFDPDEDGTVDCITVDWVGAFIVNQLTDNGDGTCTVARVEIPAELLWENDGRLFDAENFPAGNSEKIPAENVDPELKVGDMALFALTPQGWTLTRAEEANGILVDGADHEYYQIGDVQYGDAMRFSRDNILISNRCGELVNAHKYFGFLNNDDGLTVSLWFVPTVSETTGAPAGFTTGDNAKTFLARAIAFAQDKLDSVTVSADGADVDAGNQWVSQENYDALENAIARAQSVLDSDVSSEAMDYQVYLLYFALHGSGEDIGARFAGFDYEGFDNQVTVA